MKMARAAADNLAQFLYSVPLFSDLSQSSLDILAQTSRLQQFDRGDFIFYQVDRADAAYVVRSGSVAIVLTNQDGREFIINEMRPRDCFGELALLTSQPRSTAAVAREKCEILVIGRQVFLSVLDNDPRLARRLLEITADRLASSSERESAMAFLDATARLARVLLQMDQQESERGYVTTSQEELAQRTGLTRQTVAKTLGQWRRQGWLVTGRGRIMLLDRHSLQNLSDQSGE
jgi:CRP-like cAMP-binding protein